MQLSYVGVKPTRHGNYVVMDMETGQNNIVEFCKMFKEEVEVCVSLRSGSIIKIDKYLKPTQRWFLIPIPTTEDIPT